MILSSLIFKLFLLFIFSLLTTFAIYITLVDENNPNQNKNRIILLFRDNYLLKIFLLAIPCCIVFIYTSKTMLELWRGFVNPVSYFPDFKCFYLASKMTLEGINPYLFDLDLYSKSFIRYFDVKPNTFDGNLVPFAYPPNIIPFVLPLGYFTSSFASQIFFVINFISLILLFLGGIFLLEDRNKRSILTYIVLLLSIYGVLYNLNLGQVSSITASIVVWAIIFVKRGNDLFSGFLLGISTIKPTLSMFFIIYFIVKRKFLMVGYCLSVSLILGFIGLLMSKNLNIFEFLKLYRSNAKLFFENYINSPYTSPSRIDSAVIIARLFPSNSTLFSLCTFLLLGTFIFLVSLIVYRSQKRSKFSSEINLLEVSLIACLSLVTTYSQPANVSILALTVSFLINYLQRNLIGLKLLSFIMLCLTGISFLTYRFYWHICILALKVPRLIQLTIGSIPNYSILGILCIILISDNLNIRKIQTSDSQNLNH
jgi:Glycosyltransferase family 87